MMKEDDRELDDNISSTRSSGSKFHKSMTQEVRQLLHPLELHDRLAFETIKTVRLDFLTDEAETPVPRCQDLPSHAFSRLTGRSILVSVSHGWFFQEHPDPYGGKLDLFKNVFAPQLRKRYPHTDIQVFFYYLGLPQTPRSGDEEEIFVIAMERINSMYVYADVVVFLEVDPPSVDMTVLTATIDMSEYALFDFMDTVQVFETTSKLGPQKYDCILTCGFLKLTSSSQVGNYSGKHDVTYLKRPYGRPNILINEDRGWLFLERITTALKAAAADKACFDDIVLTNSEKLRMKILIWAEQIREAAKHSRKYLLGDFENELQSKTFMSLLDKHVVKDLMTQLIDQFSDNWKEEVEKQNTMSNRAREVLLRWGCFSEDYVKNAELLCDKENTSMGNSYKMFGVLFSISVVAPVFAVLPFTFALEPKTANPAANTVNLAVSSIWLGFVQGSLAVFLLQALNHAFAKIPMGIHTCFALVAVSFIAAPTSYTLRQCVSTIVPFEVQCVSCVCLLFHDVHLL